MDIDKTIYVNRPDLIGLDEEVVDFADLAQAMHRDVEGATEISILGGYYDADALIELCRHVPRSDRTGCSLRIAVGLESTALIPRTWADMRNVDKKLRRAGFQDVIVAVVTGSPVHFHTKLFRILRTTRPIWYIGSANPGSRRHELMVRLAGRHQALVAYVDAVFERAQVVSRPTPPVEIRTLRDFFLAGVLCHKPPAQRLFTFDAFRFTLDDRDRLAAILAGEAGIEHARPRTEGFGFSLRSALAFEEAPEDEDAVARRIHYRRSCIETVLGLWMPDVYAGEIRRRIREDENARFQRLTDIAVRLASGSGQQQVRQAFDAHVVSLNRLLREHQIEAKPVQDRDAVFWRFVGSRTATLSSEDARRRLARVLTLADMPDIWQDVHATKEFTASFFEDLSYRLENHRGGSGRAVKSLAEKLSLVEGGTPSELQDKLEAMLRTHSWTHSDWYD